MYTFLRLTLLYTTGAKFFGQWSNPIWQMALGSGVCMYWLFAADNRRIVDILLESPDSHCDHQAMVEGVTIFHGNHSLYEYLAKLIYFRLFCVIIEKGHIIIKLWQRVSVIVSEPFPVIIIRKTWDKITLKTNTEYITLPRNPTNHTRWRL